MNFAFIGFAGYIAPRHLDAIKELGGTVVAAFDVIEPSQSHQENLPSTKFFNDYSLFIEFLKTHKNSSKIDFVSVCSPNYFHFQQIKDSLNAGINVICEKPIVGSVHELKLLGEIERLTGQKVYSILQLRYHEAIKNLNKIVDSQPNKHFSVNLTYIAGRDKKYLESWKGDVEKSFGIEANIGIHFFDMLTHVFGELQRSYLHYYEPNKSSGYLKFKQADVKWFLSIDVDDLPKNTNLDSNTYRSITINNTELDFSSLSGFKDLHLTSYEEILANKGFGLEDVTPSIEILDRINNKDIDDFNADQAHPFLLNMIQ